MAGPEVDIRTREDKINRIIFADKTFEGMNIAHEMLNGVADFFYIRENHGEGDVIRVSKASIDDMIKALKMVKKEWVEK